jgi:hypothetical protein
MKAEQVRQAVLTTYEIDLERRLGHAFEKRRRCVATTRGQKTRPVTDDREIAYAHSSGMADLATCARFAEAGSKAPPATEREDRTNY